MHRFMDELENKTNDNGVPAHGPWDAPRERNGDSVAADEPPKGRWVPPDHTPTSWWVRHRRALRTLEWTATVVFLILALYYLWLLLFTSPVEIVMEPPPPTREEFMARLRELPPIAAESAWKVAARPGRWLGVVIHHTDTDGGSPEAIDRYHKENNKWENGLGYHFVIGNGKGMRDGEVAVGRRWLEQDKLDGAHVKKISDAMRLSFRMPEKVTPNASLIGVALVGNFEQYLPTARQLASLKGLLAFLRSEYRIAPNTVVGHGNVNNTLCPGQFFFVNEVVSAL